MLAVLCIKCFFKWFTYEIGVFLHYYVDQHVASMHHHRRVCSQWDPAYWDHIQINWQLIRPIFATDVPWDWAKLHCKTQTSHGFVSVAVLCVTAVTMKVSTHLNYLSLTSLSHIYDRGGTENALFSHLQSSTTSTTSFIILVQTVVTIATCTSWFEQEKSGHIMAMLDVTFTSPQI